MGCVNSTAVSPEQAADLESKRLTMKTIDSFERWKQMSVEFSDAIETFSMALAHWIKVRERRLLPYLMHR